MKTILICCLCLVVGVFLGRLFPPADRSEEAGAVTERKSEQASTRATFSMKANSDLDSSARDGKMSSQLDTDALEPSQDDRLLTVPASLIAELSKGSGIRTLGQELFSNDGKSEEILKITDREKAVIQTAWRSTRDKVRALEVKSSKAEDLEDGSVCITVLDLADAMGSAGCGFYDSVRGALGENRGDVFLAMKRVDRVFAPPPGERSYKVSVESIGDGRWRYHMTLEDPTGQRVWVSENIPNEIRHLTDAAQISPQMKNLPDSDK